MAKEEYCTTCKFHKSKEKLKDTSDDFCEVGYKHPPKTEVSTVNFLLNGGRVCSMNPWKSKAYQEVAEHNKTN